MAHIEAELDASMARYDRRDAAKWTVLTWVFILAGIAFAGLLLDYTWWQDYARVLLGAVIFRVAYWLARRRGSTR